MEKYYTITLKPDMTAVVHTHKALDLELPFMQEQVHGYIEIVGANIPVHPSSRNIRMIINEDGKCQKLPINTLGTAMYGNPYDVIVGDVVICSTYNPDPDAEPDVYAMCREEYEQVMSWIRSFVETDRITEVAV